MLLLIASLAVPVTADVTGSFETRVSVTTDQTPDNEVNRLLFDVESDLNVTVGLDGLAFGFHTHTGLAGVEDVIADLHAAIGLLELTSQTTLARFDVGERVPFYTEPHLIQQALRTRMPFSGFEITHLGIIEDTTAFDPEAPVYAFGSVTTLEGEANGRATMISKIGVCTERSSLVIKKHVLSPYTVNSACAQAPKPDLLFDFAQLNIKGISLAQGVKTETLIDCERTSACSLTQTLAFQNGVVPISAEFRFRDLTAISLDQVVLSIDPDFGRLRFSLQSDAELSLSSVRTALRLSEAPNAVDLKLNVRFADSAGVGLANGSAILSVQDDIFSTSITALLASQGQTLRLSTISMRTVLEIGAGELDGSVSYATEAMISGAVGASIRF